MQKRFLEYTLNEGAGLSRIISHMANRPFAIISAFRNEYSKSDNLKRTKEMQTVVRNEGYGYIRMEGAWIENGDVEVVEYSNFIVGNAEADFDDFASVMTEIGVRFDQEAIVVGDMESVWLVFADGNKERIGSVDKINTSSIGEFYSKIKGRRFAFAEHVEYLINRLEFGSKISDLFEALDVVFASEGVTFSLIESADVDDGDILFGGWYDSVADANQEPSIEIDIFAPGDEGYVVTKETWAKRKSMLADTLKHELRHRYQYGARQGAEQRKVMLPEGMQYLGNPDEIDAYAINVADELRREHGEFARINLKNLSEAALSRNAHGELVSPSLYGYYRTFEASHPVMKSLVKKVARNLSEFAISSDEKSETDYGLFLKTKPTPWTKNAPLFHATSMTAAVKIINKSWLLGSDGTQEMEKKIAPEQHKGESFNSFAFTTESNYIRRSAREIKSRDVVMFEVDPNPLRKRFPMYRLDFRDTFNNIASRLGVGDEKEVRIYLGNANGVDRFLESVRTVHILMTGGGSPEHRQIVARMLKAAKTPVYFYAKPSDFLNRNTSKSVQLNQSQK